MSLVECLVEVPSSFSWVEVGGTVAAVSVWVAVGLLVAVMADRRLVFPMFTVLGLAMALLWAGVASPDHPETAHLPLYSEAVLTAALFFFSTGTAVVGLGFNGTAPAVHGGNYVRAVLLAGLGVFASVLLIFILIPGALSGWLLAWPLSRLWIWLLVFIFPLVPTVALATLRGGLVTGAWAGVLVLATALLVPIGPVWDGGYHVTRLVGRLAGIVRNLL